MQAVKHPSGRNGGCPTCAATLKKSQPISFQGQRVITNIAYNPVSYLKKLHVSNYEKQKEKIKEIPDSHD